MKAIKGIILYGYLIILFPVVFVATFVYDVACFLVNMYIIGIMYISKKMGGDIGDACDEWFVWMDKGSETHREFRRFLIEKLRLEEESSE